MRQEPLVLHDVDSIIIEKGKLDEFQSIKIFIYDKDKKEIIEFVRIYSKGHEKMKFEVINNG